MPMNFRICHILLTVNMSQKLLKAMLELLKSMLKPNTSIIFILFYSICNEMQAFRFMEGPRHCPMISKYGPSLSKAVGPVDPSFLVVKKSHFNINIHLKTSLQTPQKRKYM